MVKSFLPNGRAFHSIPLITLCDFVFTPNRAYPATTYGSKQPSLAGQAQVLKRCSLWNDQASAKKERVKNKAMLG